MSSPFEKVDKARDLARSGDYNGALKLINEWLLAYEQMLNNVAPSRIAPMCPNDIWWISMNEYYRKSTDPKKIKYPKTYDEINNLYKKLF